MLQCLEPDQQTDPIWPGKKTKKSLSRKGLALLIQIISSTFAINLPVGRQVNPIHN